MPKERPLKSFDDINPGDIIQHLGTGHGYVVMERVVTPSGRSMAFCVRSLIATMPDEWKVIKKYAKS
jgi:hypothetical protein